jgi:hypothetical protein
MNTKILHDLLRNALKEVSPDASLRDLNIAAHYASVASPRASPHLIELLNALRADPELNMFNGSMVHAAPGGPEPIEYKHLTAWLLWRSILGGVEQALDDLRTYLAALRFRARLPWFSQVSNRRMRTSSTKEFRSFLGPP